MPVRPDVASLMRESRNHPHRWLAEVGQLFRGWRPTVDVIRAAEWDASAATGGVGTPLRNITA
jgi:hypothetical protein